MSPAGDAEVGASDSVLSAQAFLTEAIEDTTRWAQTNEDAEHVHGRLRDVKEITDELALAIFTPLSPDETNGLSETVGETVVGLCGVAAALEVWRDRSTLAKDVLYSVWNAADALAEAHDAWLRMNGQAPVTQQVSAVDAQPAITPTNARQLDTGR